MPAAENIENRVSEIKEKLGSDSIKEALQRSLDLADEYCQDQLNYIYIIKSHFSKLKKDAIMGLVPPEQEMQTRTKLLMQLLCVVDEIQDTAMAVA